MKEITKEILIQNGFDCNHPDYVLCKFHLKPKNSEKWHITLEQEYLPLSNELGWNVNCWNTNEKGTIIKRAQVGFINTLEDLNTVIALCGIDLTID